MVLRCENFFCESLIDTIVLQEEVVKVQSNLQLDLNLEKGRIKEEVPVLITAIVSIDCTNIILGHWTATRSEGHQQQNRQRSKWHDYRTYSLNKLICVEADIPLCSCR